MKNLRLSMFNFIRIIGAGIIIGCGFFQQGSAGPEKLTVSPKGPYRDISAALLQAQGGDTILVQGGQYNESLTIDKPVTLVGYNRPVIDGSNRGTLIEIAAPYVKISGFIIRNSGISLDQEHAGISINASHATIENNHILHVLFGVYMRRADSTVVRGNLIQGKQELAVPRRGDLIRAWYTNTVIIEDNTLQYGRDMIIWFSKNSVVRNNRVNDARYGVHFMYSDDCRIEDNILNGNSVGVYLMYSRRLLLRHNTIAYNRGPSGFGIGLKDFDDGLLEENLVVDNRVGIFVDNSPREIDSKMTYRGNAIAYNDIGISLLSFVQRSSFTKNSFIENYEQVGVTGTGMLSGNQWNHNYWSDYVGYDRAGDGDGDLPYKSEKLFENLMAQQPPLRLFIYSPAIQALDFAARAFPVVKPQPKLEDPRPRMDPYIPQGLSGIDLPTRWPLAAAGLGLMAFGIILIAGFSRTLTQTSAEKGAKKSLAESEMKDELIGTEPSQGVKFMIQAKNITKRFGKLTAVDNVSFQIKKGEAVAFWGSNGAGKTTVLRCLLGVIEFDGQVLVNGFDVTRQSKQARRMIGFVPQEISFHDNLSVQETIEFYARLKKTTLDTIGDWVKRLDLEPHTSKTVKELSGGMKQRLALAIALLDNPPILFLDEPTANLDMRSRDNFLDLLSDLKREGKTIVFSSHRMEEVFSFADRVLVLDQGKLITDSAPREVYKQLGKRSLLRIYIADGQTDTALKILEEQGFKVSQNGSGLKVQVDSHSKGQPITLLANEGIAVENFDYEVER